MRMPCSRSTANAAAGRASASTSASRGRLGSRSGRAGAALPVPVTDKVSRLSRRSFLIAGAGAAAAASLPKSLAAQPGGLDADTIVIGAGVFGAWTATRLREGGRNVMLVDAWGPANARASSGGESRMTRGSYGADEVYTRMALDSLVEWRALSARSGLPIFHELGVCSSSPMSSRSSKTPCGSTVGSACPPNCSTIATMRRRFPQIDFDGIAAGLFEPRFGALMARRAVQTLVAEFVRGGGPLPPGAGAAPRLVGRHAAAHRHRRWRDLARQPLRLRLRALARAGVPEPARPAHLPDPAGGVLLLAPARRHPLRARTAAGLGRFQRRRHYYGFPDLESRGFKIAHDAHGPPMDPDTGDRTLSPAALADVRAFMARRFPALADRPLNESRVCQYENSSNGDFLIDRHPAFDNVVLVGGGSGTASSTAPRSAATPPR